MCSKVFYITSFDKWTSKPILWWERVLQVTHVLNKTRKIVVMCSFPLTKCILHDRYQILCTHSVDYMPWWNHAWVLLLNCAGFKVVWTWCSHRYVHFETTEDYSRWYFINQHRRSTMDENYCSFNTKPSAMNCLPVHVATSCS